MAAFLHSGDLGDAIFALPSIRALGGGILYFASRPWTRTRWGPSLLGLIKPLVDGSGFCQAFLHDGEWIDFDFSTFRHGGHKLGDTIVERQRRWVGADISLEPWLRAEPNRVAPIVINRATRWHGFHFPWERLLEELGREMVFIGLPSEHQAFEREFGEPVEYYHCSDLQQAAEVIAGAELFIGNQSACNAIANGLGKALVLEVCSYACDCFLRRDNAFFSLNGEVEIEIGFDEDPAPARKLSLPPYDGPLKTEVGGRVLSSDNMDKLRVIARSAHAFDGTFVFYDDVQLLTNN